MLYKENNFENGYQALQPSRLRLELGPGYTNQSPKGGSTLEDYSNGKKGGGISRQDNISKH